MGLAVSHIGHHLIVLGACISSEMLHDIHPVIKREPNVDEHYSPYIAVYIDIDYYRVSEFRIVLSGLFRLPPCNLDFIAKHLGHF